MPSSFRSPSLRALVAADLCFAATLLLFACAGGGEEEKREIREGTILAADGVRIAIPIGGRA